MKRIFLLLSAVLMGLTSQAQTIQNASFEDDTPVSSNVRTYAKDITDNDVSGMQEVTGWTIVSNGDARAAGVFELGSQYFLGGSGNLPPTTNAAGETTGNILGIVACWSGDAQYTQAITLPAGTYTINYSIYNEGGTTAISKSHFGFIADNGTEYLATEKTFSVGKWTTISVQVNLDAETSGKLSMGYNSANCGSGSSPKLFVDYVQIVSGVDKSGLADEIERAKAQLATYSAGTEWYNLLNTAIAEAETAYATATTGDEVKAATAALIEAEEQASILYNKQFYANLASGDYGIQNVGAKNADAPSYIGAGNSWGTQGSLLEYATFTGVTQLADGRYELDLHAFNNQSASARLSSSLWADGGLPGSEDVAFKIYPQGDGYVITFDDQNYVCYNGTNTVLGTTTDKESEEALWTITSKADILAQIAAMEEGDDPIEITGMIGDPGFNRHNNDYTAWTYTSSGGTFSLSNGDNSSAGGANYNMQMWNGTFDMYQTLEVPNGIYKMSVQGFYRDGDDDEAGDKYLTDTEKIRGYIYANNKEQELISIFKDSKEEEDDTNGFTYYSGDRWIPNTQANAGLTFAAGYYLNELEEIAVTDGKLTIGAKNPENTANDWVVLKNFRLWYMGPVSNIGDIALQNAIDVLQPYIDGWDSGEKIYSEASRDQAETLVSEAESTMGSDVEVCNAKAKELTEFAATIAEEITQYTNLKALVEQVRSNTTVYAEFSIASKLDEMLTQYEDAYENREATVAEITTWTTGYKAALAGLLGTAMSEASDSKPLDITPMYDNMDGSSTTDWTCNASAFKSNYGNSEVWNASFDCNRTFADLPKGAYNIQVKAFQRYGTALETMSASDDDITTYVYAGISQKKVKNISEAASETQEYNGYTELSDYGVWLPNTQESAGYYFTTYPETFLTTVSTAITEDKGSLTIGIKNSEVYSNDWSVWTDWHISYVGASASSLYAEVQTLYAQASTMLESGEINTDAAYDKLEAAMESAEGVSEGSSVETLTEVINELKGAIDYYNNGLELIEKIKALVEDYNTTIDTYEGSSEKYDNLAIKMNNAIETLFTATSNEEMQEWIDEYPSARVDYIIGNLSEASEDNPINITAVIENYKFNTVDGSKPTGSTTGWTTLNMGYQNNSDYQAWDRETNALMVDEEGNAVYGFQGFAQNWTSSTTESIADSYIKQTIQGLPSGRYILGAYCVATSQAVDREVTGATIFANDNTTAIDGDVYGESSQGKPKWYEVEFYLGSNEDLTIGINFTQGYCKWFGCDNFKLTCIGTSQKGDVNGDGVVDIADVNAILTVMFEAEPTEQAIAKADVNKDGSVDIADVNAVLTEMFK